MVASSYPGSDGVVVTPVDESDAAFRSWWRRLALTGGLISIALGLILMIWPDATLTVVSILVGLWLLLAGVVKLGQAAFIPEGRSAGSRVLQAIAGLLMIILGVICMRNLTKSLVLIALIIGVGWLFGGLIEIFAAFSPLTRGWGRVGALLLGLISIAGAFVVIFWPEISLRVLVWLAGLWFVAIGLIQLILGWRADRAMAR